MLGAFRFVLALLVLLSHIPGVGLPLNFGVSAVILFYFISGYLMGRSYTRFRLYSATPVRDFYVDRLLKLMPQYWLVLVLSIVLIYWLGPAQYTMFFNQAVDPLKVVMNVLLLPANYLFEPLLIESVMPGPIVPPAWSLSTEFHFYLLLPLIFLLGSRGFALVAIASAAVQITAMFYADGLFNSNNFGYRFIFGVLVFFLAGSAYGLRENIFYKRIAQSYYLLYLFTFLVVAPSFGLYSHPLVAEVLLGAVLTLPLLSTVLNAKSQGARMVIVDDFLGRLAYPIFISHFLVFFCCEKLFGLVPSGVGAYVLAAITGTLFVSLLLVRLQTWVERYRLHRRSFSSMATVKNFEFGTANVSKS